MNDRFCGNCGTPLQPDGKCPVCDKATQKEVFCGKCGKPLRTDGNCPFCDIPSKHQGFCGNCGKPLGYDGKCTQCKQELPNHTQSYVNTKSKLPEKPKKNRDKKPVSKKTKVISAILAFTIAFSGIGSYFAMSYQAKAVINDKTIPSVQTETDENAQQAQITENAQTAQFSPNIKVFSTEESAKINSAIMEITAKQDHIEMKLKNGTELESIGTGDIFYLEGSESTPFGETYIGKITSVSDIGSFSTYTIESPMVDEVFDVLKIDYTKELTTNEIDSIETADGVTVEYTDEAFSAVESLAKEKDTKPIVSTLSNTTSTSPEAKPLNTDKDLLINIEIDVLDLLKKKEDSATDNQKVSAEESKNTTVYITDTGDRYHKEFCFYLHSSKKEISLNSAILEDYTPCLICQPPVIIESIEKETIDEKTGEKKKEEKKPFLFEPSLTLKGKVGIESFSFNCIFDWDILNGKGINEISAHANGNFVAAIGAEGSLNLTLRGKKSEINLPFNFAKFEGLTNKLIPIAYITYNGVSISAKFIKSTDQIEQITGSVPLSVGILIYSDINGNLTAKLSAEIEYNYNFDISYTAVKDGKWVNECTSTGNPSLTTTLDFEISGDFTYDVLGASLVVYVFNLNIMDLAIAKVGIEAEGAIKASISRKWEKIDGNTAETAKNELSGYIYARCFVKLFDINIRLKTKIHFWIFTDISTTLDYTYTFFDYTVIEWGAKKETKFNSSSMSYTAVTAKDTQAKYYKDTNGQLIKEENGYKTVLFKEDFFSICGIDTSYIYLLIPNENKYELRRIAKDGTAERTIADDVANMLMMDDLYFYYISTFDQNVIIKLDRENFKQSEFAAFDKAVRFMQKQEDYYYYVVAEDTDSFAAIFGPTSYCYLLNATGEILHSYGTSPSVKQFYRTKVGDYYEAARMVSNGYLRSTASEIYWMSEHSPDKTVNAEGISGWNPLEAGIFTTLNGEDGKFKIVLYKAENGERIDITDVDSDQAFFTLCESKSGNWYFFDQTEDKLILYKMPSDFSVKEAIKEFSLDETPYSLTTCSMTIMDNTIYFFTMPDDTTSKVLYRYTVN